MRCVNGATCKDDEEDPLIAILFAIIGVGMAYTALVLYVTKLKDLHEEFYEEYGGSLEDPKPGKLRQKSRTRNLLCSR